MLICDIVSAVTTSIEIMEPIRFQIVYIHIFILFKEITMVLNKNSSIMFIYDVFTQNIWTYLLGKRGIKSKHSLIYSSLLSRWF